MTEEKEQQKFLEPLDIEQKSVSTVASEFSNEVDFNEEYLTIIEQEEDNDGVDTNVKEEDKITVTQAVINLANINLGSTILCLPYIFSELGIILGIIMLILNSIICTIVVQSLLLCKDITRKYGYSIFGKITMGTFGTILVKLTIAVSNFGVCCVYFKLFGNYTSTVIETITKTESVKNFFNQPLLYVIIGFLIMLPLIIKNNDAIINKASIAGMSGILTFLFTFIILFFRKVYNGEIHFHETMLFPSKKSNFIKKMACLPTLFLSFSFHYNTFPLYLSLKNRNNKSMITATIISLIISLLVFAAVGLMGYVMYSNSSIGISEILILNMTKDITSMLNGENKNYLFLFLYVFCIIIFLIACLLSVPVSFSSASKHFLNLILYIKKKTFKMFHSGDSISNVERIIYPLLVYIFLLIMAITVKNIMSLFNFVGSTGSSMISFILPGVFAIKLIKANGMKKGKCTAYFILVYGIIGVVSFYLPEVYNIFM